MATFNSIKVGDVLYDCHRYKMGNTNRSAMGCWEVRVISIDSVKRTALCSWNSNPPTVYSETRLARLRRTKVKG